MTTQTNDDIIELTDIVEEGMPLDQSFDDFDMDKAVDAKSLDEELDALFREAEPPARPAPKGGDEIDFNALFAEAQDASAKPKPEEQKPADSGMDLSDLGDLFDSLHIDDTEEVNSLELMLGEQPITPQKTAQPTPQAEESIDLDLDIPGMDSDEPQDLLELTDELLAEVPNTFPAPTQQKTPSTPPAESLLPSPEALELEFDMLESGATRPAQPLAPAAPAESFLSSPEALDLDLDELDTDIAQTAQVPAAEASPESLLPSPEGLGLEIDESANAETVPVLTQAATAATPEAIRTTHEAGISQADLEILSARIDALEARPEPGPALEPEQIVAMLPQSPEDLALTRALRDEIMAQLDARIANMSPAAALEDMRNSIGALQTRIDALPDLGETLASVASTADVRALQADLAALGELVRNQEQASTTTFEALRQAVEAATSRLDAMPDPAEALSTAAPLADLLSTQADLNALRDQVLVLEQTASETLPGLRQAVDAAGARLDAMPDIAEALAELQSLQAALDTMREQAQSQERSTAETFAGLQQAIDAVTTRLDTMPDPAETLASAAPMTELHSVQADLDALRAHVAAIPERTDEAAAMQELESELTALRQLVRDQSREMETMRQTLSEKDAAMALMRSEGAELRTELEALGARLDSTDLREALKAELLDHIRQQVPLAAARIIREEIQNLVKEMG